MSSASTTPPDPPSDSRLPRWPHSLTREEVANHQRERLMSAMTDSVGEQGYTATTVADVIARAGVSRKAFYEHFANKQECFLATYDTIVAEGLERVNRATSEGEGPVGRAGSGIEALFERAIENPNVLRLVMVEIGAVGPAGTARREQLAATYEQLLRENLGLPPRAGATIPNPVMRAVVGGVNRVLYTRVQSGEQEQLPGLVPDLVRWITSYYPAPASMMTLQDPRPSHPSAGLVGGRAPGTLAPASSRRGLARSESNISRSLVVHSQRERILDAIANLSAAKGYAALKVDDIAQEAAVSLQAFYKHFTGKEDAFIVAYEVGHGKGLALVERAYDAAPDWPTGIRAAIVALFDFLASEPAFAQLALVDALIATPNTAERANRGMTPYARMLMPGLEEAAEQSRPPAVTVEAVVGGIFELCFGYGVQGHIGELSELVPRATYFALAPFIGPEEAARIATEGVATDAAA